MVSIGRRYPARTRARSASSPLAENEKTTRAGRAITAKGGCSRLSKPRSIPHAPDPHQIRAQQAISASRTSIDLATQPTAQPNRTSSQSCSCRAAAGWSGNARGEARDRQQRGDSAAQNKTDTHGQATTPDQAAPQQPVVNNAPSCLPLPVEGSDGRAKRDGKNQLCYEMPWLETLFKLPGRGAHPSRPFYLPRTLAIATSFRFAAR